MANKTCEKRKPTAAEAYITLAFMLLALVILYAIVGLDLKITLLIVLVFNVIMVRRCGVTAEDNIKAIGDRIGGLGFFFIVLFGIGFLVAGLMMGGTIPVLVSWLVKLISPNIVLLLCFVLPGILSIAVISSFATLGTLGIIMFSVAVMQGIPAPLAAAACICGSNVGQYFSPLGDTTNLCAQVNDISIGRFIKGFSPSFGISVVLTCIFFLIMGGKYSSGAAESETISEVITWVSANYKTSILVLLPFVVTIVLALLKVNSVWMIYGTGIVGLLLACTLQKFNLLTCLNALYNGFSSDAFFPGVEVPSIIADLLNRGGIYSMADGICFFIIMLACIAIYDAAGIFDVVKETIFKGGKTYGSLTVKASLASLVLALIACESYTTIMLSAEISNKPFKEAGYDGSPAANIGMAMGQLTAYLCPWSFLAIYMGIICGVGVLEYAKYAILFWIVPIVIIVLGLLGVGKKAKA